MATETSSSDSTTDGTAETAEGQQSEEQQSTSETDGQDGTTDSSTQQDDQSSSTAPDPAKQALQRDLYTERKARKASQARVAELEGQVNELTPKAETTEAIQAKYDRLEAFLVAAGGPLGKALDSRTFSQRLFESTDDIADIVKDWNKANPSATSQALGSSAQQESSKKPDMNALLRAAAKG